jgi:hypothetical protein
MKSLVALICLPLWVMAFPFLDRTTGSTILAFQRHVKRQQVWLEINLARGKTGELMLDRVAVISRADLLLARSTLITKMPSPSALNCEC